ncbi:hypothetical protein JRO89_XSUnG0215400 [Xanthoceras sorbifolium]|uniref:Uncharacterized protein n=1 Tax=Xanthoceras sorbifolium TaxID=99658 RepID=A0ABQ8GWY9_9ROSI|nr:hypothetical protein JRO89_XSUnG0215400 [Xanthoceras sorbifolium]
MMVVVSSSLAADQAIIRRGVLGGIYGQEQRHHHVEKRKAHVEGKRSRSVEYPDRSTDNHHNIPRQNYNDWSAAGSSGDTGDNSDDGTRLLVSGL